MLGKLQDDKATLRHHLELVWSKTGKKPQQLVDAVQVPSMAVHVWGWFISLCNERGNNGMSASRITAENVKNWMWFNGVASLELWEKKAIAALDDVWMKAQND